MADSTLVVRTTLQLWRNAAYDASRALVRNSWVVGLVPLYTVALTFVGGISGGLGMAGGFVNYLVLAACVGSFLSVVGESVEHGRPRFGELGTTFGRLLGPVASVFFVLWIIGLLLGLVLQQNPQMAWLALAVQIGVFIAFNPLPELIQQSSTAGAQGAALLDEAFRFVRENALEWLVPLGLMLAPFFLLAPAAGLTVMARFGATTALDYAIAAVASLVPLAGPLGQVVAIALASTLIVWIMLFRGFLFRALARGGRRQRIFQARLGR